MKVAIIPVDTAIFQKQKDDECSVYVKKQMGQVGFKIEMIQPVPNDKEVLSKILAKIADDHMADLILTIGGIGCRKEDCTPEATKAVLEKEVSGIGEAMRMYMIRTRKRAMTTRGTAGIRNQSLIVNLPANMKVLQECLSYVLSEIVYTTEVVLGEHDDIIE